MPTLRFFAKRVLQAAAIGLAVLSPLLALAQKGSTPLIYEVASATNTVYLFGTIHVGVQGLYPLSPAVEEAFARSKVLALEADPNDQAGLIEATKASLYQPPDNLLRHISPELRADLLGVLPRVGLPIEYAQSMKPHLLAMTIAIMELGRLGYDARLGLDMYLARRAQERGMQLVQLESLAEQMALLDRLSLPVQQAMLALSVRMVANGELEQETQALLAAWTAGDPDKLNEVLERENTSLPDGASAELRELMYTKRNHAMADKIETVLAGNVPHFVAVGAGHLLNADGLVALLRSKGYAVRRL
jgi:uncharacterized protein YbaP (TraB family)